MFALATALSGTLDPISSAAHHIRAEHGRCRVHDSARNRIPPARCVSATRSAPAIGLAPRPQAGPRSCSASSSWFLPRSSSSSCRGTTAQGGQAAAGPLGVDQRGQPDGVGRRRGRCGPVLTERPSGARLGAGREQRPGQQQRDHDQAGHLEVAPPRRTGPGVPRAGPGAAWCRFVAQAGEPLGGKRARASPKQHSRTRGSRAPASVPLAQWGIGGVADDGRTLPNPLVACQAGSGGRSGAGSMAGWANNEAVVAASGRADDAGPARAHHRPGPDHHPGRLRGPGRHHDPARRSRTTSRASASTAG